MIKKTTQSAEKASLHPRNAHRERYDFPALIETLPALAQFVKPNKYGDLSITFADAQAVKMLNKALLKHFYQIEQWDIPQGHLCPPIPGRADYLHYVADILSQSNAGRIPQGANVTALDVGVGANCIYPLLGNKIYGWRFTGSDTSTESLNSAKAIVAGNSGLDLVIRLRQQKDEQAILNGVISKSDEYDVILCNPPFHGSESEAKQSTQRKSQNLGLANKAELNFGGKHHELWCNGGEVAFITTMINESANKPKQVLWYTSLVSKKEHLKELYAALRHVGAEQVKTIEMAQGQKISRFIAWSFQSPEQQKRWAKRRWNQ